MDDLISRQAAIDALSCINPTEPYLDYDDAVAAIKALPSAQPEPNYDEWCTDCKEYDHKRHCCPRWNRVIRQTLKDMKEEQPESEPIDPNEIDIEILSALRSKYCCFDEKEERVYHALSESIKAINSLEQLGKENR